MENAWKNIGNIFPVLPERRRNREGIYNKYILNRIFEHVFSCRFILSNSRAFYEQITHKCNTRIYGIYDDLYTYIYAFSRFADLFSSKYEIKIIYDLNKRLYEYMRGKSTIVTVQ